MKTFENLTDTANLRYPMWTSCLPDLCCPQCFSYQGTISFLLFHPKEMGFFQPCNQKSSAFRTCHWLAPSCHSGLYHMSALQRHPPCLSFLVLQLASCVKSTAYCYYVAFSINSLCISSFQSPEMRQGSRPLVRFLGWKIHWRRDSLRTPVFLGLVYSRDSLRTPVFLGLVYSSIQCALPRQPCLSSQVEQGFLCSLLPFQYLVQAVVKSPPADARDSREAGSIPALGRSPTVGNDNPLWYSCLENSKDRETFKELDMTEHVHAGTQ